MLGGRCHGGRLTAADSRRQMPRQVPWRQAAQKKITNSAQNQYFARFSIPRAHQSLPQTPNSIPEGQLFISRVPLPLHPSTKMAILCSKCPKTWVSKAKSAQKPRFCARNARKQGFQSQKAHKNPDFVLGKKGIGSGKRRYWHRKAQPWPSCKSPRTLSKCKCFITR